MIDIDRRYLASRLKGDTLDKLLKEERQQLILKVLQERKRVTIKELCDSFSTSAITIRRDLHDLSHYGLIQRTHRGAILALPIPPEIPVIQRMAQSKAYKEIIGKFAAELVFDGESVFIGSGSTTIFVARYLKDRENLTIVTNALNIATELASAEGITVVVTGGMLRASELSLIGHITEQALREVRVDKVIIGIPAISLEAGLTNDYLPEVMTDRTIIRMSPHLILVADHTKFDKIASAYVAPINQVTTLVTDSVADSAYLSRIEALGVGMIIAKNV